MMLTLTRDWQSEIEEFRLPSEAKTLVKELILSIGETGPVADPELIRMASAFLSSGLYVGDQYYVVAILSCEVPRFQMIATVPGVTLFQLRPLELTEVVAALETLALAPRYLMRAAAKNNRVAFDKMMESAEVIKREN